jgi:predicted RNase H-like HicB family nuclease
MTDAKRRPLEDYLSAEYPFNVTADPDGGYVILFPDLPGCMTQVESLEAIPLAAAEIRELWIETEFEAGRDVPPPSFPEEYSGKFNVRLPKSLHRRLVESAARDDVSLNQYVMTLLDRRDALARLERRLVDLEARLAPSPRPAVPPSLSPAR